MARVYVWYIDETDARDGIWRPGSWADAEAGIVRHRNTGEVRSHALVGYQSDEDNCVHLVLTKSPVLLVAVDPINRFYAWRVFRYKIPLESIRVPVTFRVWRWEQPYVESDWTVVSAQSEEENSEEL
jgi:hypothetical protein